MPVPDTDSPADLLELQRRWYTAEAGPVADPSEEERPASAAVSAELYSHAHHRQGPADPAGAAGCPQTGGAVFRHNIATESNHAFFLLSPR
ncbi:hypothetical protein GCM10010502_02780 [Kitasatospora aureofaciens]|uniref:Uncharacterized protein n=1 Tax=Kitasatospora aureofaciens TaxID=1894 RepID=A0A8H9LN46_KITAU|nr:hypothetical protein GCM10010502_02780 [Kitasatospora aureofaciens]